MQKNKPRDIIRTMEYLQSLNEEQLAAVEHSGSPLLILAGAGSGKTRVITTKIAYLISEKIKASSILAVTFTKKAAAEMMQRLVNWNRLPHIAKFAPFTLLVHGSCVYIIKRLESIQTLLSMTMMILRNC